MPVPSGYDMGPNPQWLVVKNYDGAPDGYYLPDQAFLEANEDAIRGYVGAHIGDWAIVAYDGGKLCGAGYNSGNSDCSGAAINTAGVPVDMPSNYYVYYDEAITDVLVVKADASVAPYVAPEDVPTCDVEGYDCECERMNPIDPFSRKPTPDSDDYTFYGQDVGLWHSMISSYGYTGSWTPIPDGYWGYWILLN